MKLLRKLMGLDFPDPQVGQVWRSRNSGRAFRVQFVQRSDCGRLWHIDLQHEDREGRLIPIGMSCCMFPSQWRWKLREEARELVGHYVPEPAPWPAPPPRNP